MTIQSVGLLDAIKTPANPFPGLRPFESNESHLFFGRDEQIGKLLAKFAQTRFLAVVGTSGSGKSSLVRAGLIPALRSGMLPSAKGKWRIAVMRPSNDPTGNLVRALNAPDVFGSAEPENEAIQQAITEATLRLGSQGLIEVANQNLMTGDENLLVLVDQFEELFRYLREARKAKNPQAENDAADFVKLLLESVKDKANIYVVITMRSDFLGDCSQFPDFPEAITESQYLIPRLTRDQLREVIEGPIAVGGGQISPRLVSQLLNDIADDQDQLPILQHALMRTWNHWIADRGLRIADSRNPVTGGTDGATGINPQAELRNPQWIDLEHYEAIGGMANALSKHADEAYVELPDDRHRQIAERMFKALTEKGEDNREIRRPVEFGKLCTVAEATEEELTTVIETFREPGRSFLMPPVGTKLGEKTLVDISHESFIRIWSRLQIWASEEAESATFYRRMVQTANLYKAGKSELWRGIDLQEGLEWQIKSFPTEAWAHRYSPSEISWEQAYSVFETAIAFLHASKEESAEEQRKQERKRQEEVERTKRELARTQELVEAQKQAAEAKEQARNLELLVDVGHSVYELTHELGNNLGLISSYIQNIRETLTRQNIASTVINEELDNIFKDISRVLNMSAGIKSKFSESKLRACFRSSLKLGELA
jgi:energy-coupling factor transporter ATP-binding protein EcfA2